jgi:hypothetical protein
MGTLARNAWQDSTGPADEGTVIGNAELQVIYDVVEGDIRSSSFPAITLKSVTDNLMARVPFLFGGSPNQYVDDVTYASGSTYDKLAPDTRVWRVDSAWLAAGTYVLEAILKTDNAASPAKIALINLTDNPNAPVTEVGGATNVELSSISLTGELLRSNAILFPAAGVQKDYGVKLITDAPGNRAMAWGIQLIRTT